MPRIPDTQLNCVVYLYPTKEDAVQGKRVGGTGFLVGIRSEKYPEARAHTYVVANSHMINEAQSPVVRINTKDGGFDILELGSSDWLHHPDGDDIAISSIEFDTSKFGAMRVATTMFITPEIIQEHKIGPGDETYFIGRFISHEGKQRNTPSVRFGNISMMPGDPVAHPRGYSVESFQVEARSLSGYSGSPVFVFTAPFYPRPGQRGVSSAIRGPYLLGVDWGHFPDYKPLLESDKLTHAVPERFVEHNSGIANIAPAWKIQELLDSEGFLRERGQKEQEWEKEFQENPPAVLDSAQSAITKEESEEALRRISR